MEFRPDVAAGKYDPSQFDPTGMRLLVNEVFHSFQGEGANTGRAAVFVRMAKCNLACSFCDTEFEVGSFLHVEDVWTRVRALAPPGTLVVFTGGEPALQNLGPLAEHLLMDGYHLSMETSGSVWSPWMEKLSERIHICVSPKVKLHTMNEALMLAASEFKWIVNAAFLKQYHADPDACFVPGTDNFLQPESQNPKWTAAAIKLVQQHPERYRLSLQTHKFVHAP